MLTPDPQALRATYRWLKHQPFGVTEVRVIGPGVALPGEKSGALVGFTDSEDGFVKLCTKRNDKANVYVGIQPRPARLLPRAHDELRRKIRGARETDIEVICSQVIDFDPVRAKDTPSTDDELEAAKARAILASARLLVRGYKRPVLVMSGNGVQLWLAVEPVELTEDNRATVTENMKRFEAEVRSWAEIPGRVSVDSIHDPPRIIKAIGTVSRKGEHTDKRPHRRSEAIDAQIRTECETHTARLIKPIPQDQPRLPIVTDVVELEAIRTAARTAEGGIYYKRPVYFCGPVARLWDQGPGIVERDGKLKRDRSLAIWAMILWFLFQRLPKQEITEMGALYGIGVGKLKNRDPDAYLRSEYDKALQYAGKPPCHVLQEMGYCLVGQSPSVRCDLQDIVVGVEHWCSKVDDALPDDALPYRLKILFEHVASQPESDRAEMIDLIASRFEGLSRESIDKQLELAEQQLRLKQDAELDFDSAGGADEGIDAPSSGGEGASDGALSANDFSLRNFMDGQVMEDLRSYYVHGTKGEPKVISSFSLQPTVKVRLPEGPMFVCRAHCDNGVDVDDVRLPLAAFRSKRSFLEQLRSEHMQWSGSDNNVQGLLRKLDQGEVVEKVGVQTLGAHEVAGTRYWVLPDRIITANGDAGDVPLLYLTTGASLEERVRYPESDREDLVDMMTRLCELIGQINQPSVTLPILGWFCATPFKPYFIRLVGSFPILWVWGTQGSGKSSMVTEVFWRMLGSATPEPYSATETRFTFLKTLASTTSIPVVIDEYKPHDMRPDEVKLLQRMVRRTYRGESEGRGTRDQLERRYSITAPLCVIGESRPSQAAVVERLITASPDKVYLEREQLAREAFDEIRSLSLQLFGGPFLRFCLSQDPAEVLAEGRAVTRWGLGQCERSAPTRMLHNLEAVGTGIHLFQKFAESMGIETASGDLGIGDAFAAVLNDVLDAEDRVKDPLDIFLETLDAMGPTMEIKFGQHFTWSESGDILCLHLPSCFDAFLKHVKHTGAEIEVVNKAAMVRLIDQNFRRQGYVRFPAQKTTFKEGDKRTAVWIDPRKAAHLIDESSFPKSADEDTFARRSWGGWS